MWEYQLLSLYHDPNHTDNDADAGLVDEDGNFVAGANAVDINYFVF